ncbi:YeiH family protein [Arthrobacter roseus]|uniref:YeiH family protein n=1 Tax=Arthrobacter roseus TaxID=136274 RepID=UPI001963AD73|nr:putative sulfate exporter family transporter [Arthrobacter roseus]MBM7848527.1 putative integral membrane protein (TIGR00698 family) [Arthrobacter roseus]
MVSGSRFRLSVLPGIAAAGVAVAVAFGIHWLVPSVPAMTAAVVLGILCANIPRASNAVSGVLKLGLGVAAKKFMRAGIVLLGLKVSLMDIAGLGWVSVLAIVVLVAASFGGTYAICRALRLPGDQPILISTGFSICGASAIGAMAAVRNSREQDTVVPIALVTLCGTLAIALLPFLGALANLPATVFGYWVGASVHDVGQVVATAQTAGTAALTAAVVIKLARVLTLAPITALAGIQQRRSPQRPGEETARPPLVPLFILGFIALVLVRTFVDLPAGITETAGVAQDIFLAAALFALGAGIHIRQLLTSGRAFAAAMLSWALIGAGGLGVAFLISG